MPCYYPLRGFRSPYPSPSGKHKFVFSGGLGSGPSTPLPCGQCIGCRLERARQWSVRCMYEASLYPDNCFITLTYDDAHLPECGDLNMKDFQKFMKRLRRRYGTSKIRFFACGEYGSKFARPHYHACLFGFDFADKVPFSSKGEVILYTSSDLAKLWPFGFSTVGEVNFETAGYVARYALKKVNGPQALSHYEYLDESTGEVRSHPKEFLLMSRRPGLAREWFRKFASDVYPSDYLIVRGFKSKPPRYFDALQESENKELIDAVRVKRAKEGYANRSDATYTRLSVREVIARAKLSNFKRDLEN